jgi:hypothetical protein
LTPAPWIDSWVALGTVGMGRLEWPYNEWG